MIGRRSFVLGLASTATLTRASLAAPAVTAASTLITAARAQIGVTVIYDPAYVQLAFPGGDPPRERGVCTDVVIRAYRDAFRLDLQQLVNADMRAAFSAYPRRWGLSQPNASIDHRRVPNLQTFLARKGAARPFDDPARFEPADLVTLKLPGNLDHIGIISDQRGADGLPMLVHNIGLGAREEAVLRTYPLTGRFRWLPV